MKNRKTMLISISNLDSIHNNGMIFNLSVLKITSQWLISEPNTDIKKLTCTLWYLLGVRQCFLQICPSEDFKSGIRDVWV